MADKSALGNYMNSSVQDSRNVATGPIVFRKVVKYYPKLRYKIVRVGGDLFYTMMSEEETIQKALIYVKSDEHKLQNQRDID